MPQDEPSKQRKRKQRKKKNSTAKEEEELLNQVIAENEAIQQRFKKAAEAEEIETNKLPLWLTEEFMTGLSGTGEPMFTPYCSCSTSYELTLVTGEPFIY